eukprot:scaffold264742_cov22-Tisochrysis_lutea.AAC.1
MHRGGLRLLTELSLSDNRIEEIGMRTLAGAFSGGGARHLVKLCADGNLIGNAGLVALSQAVAEGATPKLKVGDLAACS